MSQRAKAALLALAVVAVLLFGLYCVDRWVFARRPTREQWLAGLPAEQRQTVLALREENIDVYPSCKVGQEHLMNAFVIPQRGCLGTDEHLRLLATLPALDTVHVDATFVTDEGLSHLARLPLLESLSLSHAGRITDEGLRHLSGLTDLLNLELPWCGLEGGGLAHLSSLSKLYRLDLTGSRVSTGLRHLSGLPLWGLSLGDTRVDDEALAEIGRGIPTLRQLDLDGTRVTSSGLAHLAGMEQLAHLSAARTAVDDRGVRALGGLKKLYGFNLQDTRVTGTAFEAFRDMGDLGNVNLRQCPVTKEGVRALSRVAMLYSLDLSETPVTDAWLAHLHGCPKLTSLTLEGSLVSQEAVRRFHEKVPACQVKWTPRRGTK